MMHHGDVKMVAAFCTSTAPLLRIAPHRSALRQQIRGRRRIYCCAESEDGDTLLSRRVFSGGILVCGVGTAWVGYRIVVGDDLKSRLLKSIRRRLPQLFPRESTPVERRLPVNVAFARAYYDALGAVATEHRLIDVNELEKAERAVQSRASSLFFKTTEATASFSDASWLNFALYARLHVIADGTSRQQRVGFAKAVAQRTLPLLMGLPTKRDAPWARSHADAWLDDVRGLLERLVAVGWISGYRVSEFDAGSGSAWLEDGRAALTVYAVDPLTIQAAQLMGEEQYEEISPKVSPWIRVVLEANGMAVSSEDYYLDDVYRPDPADFLPSQLASEFDLSA